MFIVKALKTLWRNAHSPSTNNADAAARDARDAGHAEDAVDAGGGFEDEQPYIDALLAEGESMAPCPEDAATEVLPFLLLGDQHHAGDAAFLSQARVTHVISCIGDASLHTRALYKQMAIEYLCFEAMDSIWYDILQHYPSVRDFIDSAAAEEDGRVLIHCKRGVNRSGALAIAYYMAHEKVGPLTAAREIRAKRKRVLTNEEFQRQLIVFANSQHLLSLDRDKINVQRSVSLLNPP